MAAISCILLRPHGVLEVRDLACVKLNEPKPRRPNLIMYRLQSTIVSVKTYRFSGSSGLWSAKISDHLERARAAAPRPSPPTAPKARNTPDGQVNIHPIVRPKYEDRYAHIAG